MNASELARHLRVNRRTLYEWFAESLAEACQRPDGTYDGDAAVAWVAANKKGKKADPLAGLKKKQLRTKIAVSEEDLLLKRLKREVEAGLLIYRDDVLNSFSSLCDHFIGILEPLPDQISKECPLAIRVQTLELVTHAIERAYHLLAAWKPPTHGSPAPSPTEEV